jgi:4-hydroxy-tetrahydrodipicolinate synthase
MASPLGSIASSAVAVPTPFRDNRVDIEALARLCERHVARATSAIFVCGSTGEAASLSLSEHAQVVSVAAEAVAGRLPIIAGCTASATDVAVALAAAAARAGADGLLCAAPPYSRPTQEGIIAHMRAVAHVSDLPLVLYDVPSRSAIQIADGTVAALYEQGLIGAIKDATADLSRPPRLRAICGDALVQISGDDATAAAYRAMGGHGCISVSANVTPLLCALLHRAWESGDLASFACLRDLLHPLHAALFIESNPIPVKAALEDLGLCASTVRLPLTQAVSSTRDRLRRVLGAVMEAEESYVDKVSWSALSSKSAR